MAKLLSYYRLCPLIDTKNLLGISEDTEKGVVIVTLGKNIAIKYRLSDQKQICSWRSKEKFSSPVQYDKKLEKYAAVFNQAFVRIWTDEDETLDKVKKYKFNQPIHTILTHNEEIFVVFKTGSVYPLNEILETRKTFTAQTVLEDKEIHDIVYASVDEDLYFGIIVKDENHFTFHWTVNTYYSKNVFSKNKLFLENSSLQGCAFFVNKHKVSLLTVWSDGKIYSKELVRHDKEESDLGELFTVLENISAQHLVKVVPLDDKYIAIYGSDPDEEGAILLIYNVQFKVTQSKQIHKLYTDEAKIWKTYNFVLLPVGQNLIVVPFCLESEQLVALIGSHNPLQMKIDSDISFVTDFEVANWNDKDETEIISEKNKKKDKLAVIENTKGKQIPSSLKGRLKELFKEGLSEAAIIEQIIPEILEEENVQLLEDSLKFFTDIPEKYMAKMLQFILACNKNKFTKTRDRHYTNLPEGLLPNERVALLDKLLTRDFSEVLLLPYLRYELSIDQAVFLLQYLVYELSEDGHNLSVLNSTETETCIIKWISLLLDSNYQKFVLSKDNAIEDVLVNCQKLVSEYLDVIEGLKTDVSALARFEAEAKGKSYACEKLANSFYSIEQIDINV